MARPQPVILEPKYHTVHRVGGGSESWSVDVRIVWDANTDVVVTVSEPVDDCKDAIERLAALSSAARKVAAEIIHKTQQ